MPRASPETTVKPVLASADASRSAIRAPYGVQCREPTTAIASWSRGSMLPLDVQQARRIGNVLEWRRVFGIAARNDADVHAAAQSQLGLGVEVLAGSGDLIGELGADAGDVAQLLPESPPATRLADSKSLEQGLAGVRADARDHRQLDQGRAAR